MHDVCHGLGFQQIPFDADLQGLEDERVIRMHREQQRFCARRDPPDLTDNVQAVQQRHHHVDHRHIGLRILGKTDRFPTIAGFGDDRDPVGLDQRANPLSQQRMVVGEQQTTGDQ